MTRQMKRICAIGLAAVLYAARCTVFVQAWEGDADALAEEAVSEMPGMEEAFHEEPLFENGIGYTSDEPVFLEPEETLFSEDVLYAGTDETATVYIRGTYDTTTKEAILARINAIRLEACQEGITVNGKALTEKDYVPMKWSRDLEKGTMQRAAEARVRASHERPDGKGCFVTLNAFAADVSPSAENLAWCSSLLQGIELFYEEKYDLLNNTGGQTGHYLHMINPNYQYTAVSGFYEEGSGRIAVAQASGFDNAYVAGKPSETKIDVSGTHHVPVIVKTARILDHKITGADNVKTGKSETVRLAAMIRYPQGETEGTESRYNNAMTMNTSGLSTGTTYTVDKTDLATLSVSDDGLGAVLSGLKRGTVLITGTGKTGTAEKSIEVQDPVTGVRLDRNKIRLRVGESVTLEPVILPETAGDKTVTWKTGGDTSAIGFVNGKVTGYRTSTSPVTVTVTTKDGGFQASCEIQVYNPVTAITLNRKSLSIEPGDTYRFSASVRPYNADDPTVTFQSSDPKVATIDQNGNLKAVSKGTCKISARSADGTVSAECDVRVMVFAQSIRLKYPATVWYAGETAQLDYVIDPPDGEFDSLEWSSEDESVFTVSQSGLLTAKKPGRTTVMVSFKIGSARTGRGTIMSVLEGSRPEPESEPEPEVVPTHPAQPSQGTSTDSGERRVTNPPPFYLPGANLNWVHLDGFSFWYEGDCRQGTGIDPQGVVGDGTIRGREIYDKASDAWYWLDSVLEGAKAVNKEVWIPYIYQQEHTYSDYQIDHEIAPLSNLDDPAYPERTAEMGDQVARAIRNKTGKWVRYDERGQMIKGWYSVNTPDQIALYPKQAGNTYYYDRQTGLMAKGWTLIGGRMYYFDEVSGALW